MTNNSEIHAGGRRANMRLLHPKGPCMLESIVPISIHLGTGRREDTMHRSRIDINPMSKTKLDKFVLMYVSKIIVVSTLASVLVRQMPALVTMQPGPPLVLRLQSTRYEDQRLYRPQHRQIKWLMDGEILEMEI
ncbi:hypothetical protein M430DRAFT_184364 [Amorphotheca resinae ATCC 22711]|uniref:Uncharacterized protein n=1 Tax=Amorphotheca resinae ATCC 22711 TaxID=857342 RepID=A0A2T3AS77_AMORE|nr:hypothetical protein M430DRAFT_184364 [Amorphotheca resinae ATCC 22711]PSS09221.1 hypothetical protein M430DRAFT_184364 [Amorphotheca resinae ATCC 22711]